MITTQNAPLKCTGINHIIVFISTSNICTTKLFHILELGQCPPNYPLYIIWVDWSFMGAIGQMVTMQNALTDRGGVWRGAEPLPSI